jgi:hypothetical protein
MRENLSAMLQSMLWRLLRVSQLRLHHHQKRQEQVRLMREQVKKKRCRLKADHRRQ